MKTLTRATLLVAAAFAFTGCLSPYLKKNAASPEPKPSNVLVAGLNVRFDSGSQDKSLLDAAVDAAQNAQLAEFGQKATELSAAVLAGHGYTVTYDKARSEQLDVIQIQSNSTASALTGTWRHPECSHQTPDTVDSLFVKPSEVIGKLKKDGKEYFAFTELVIRDGGMFMKEPQVVVRTTIYDQDAKKVLDLQGIGYGESRFMFADRSPANLKTALERGFESIKAVKEEALQ